VCSWGYKAFAPPYCNTVDEILAIADSHADREPDGLTSRESRVRFRAGCRGRNA
jgi:hypothetical protein